MNAVGIDVSKGKSTVAILKPFGEVVRSPFDVTHNEDDLKSLAETIKKLKGETKVVMEATGNYHQPIAAYLHREGIFVSVINAWLIKENGRKKLHGAKTDKLDSLKIANYALDNWLELQELLPEEDIRRTLKLLNRQYHQTVKIQTTLKTNLISLLDMTFPGVNKMFSSPVRKSDGHEKWVDFIETFPHHDCVAKLSLSVFRNKYRIWCKKNKYAFSDAKAAEIHNFARRSVSALPMNEGICALVVNAVKELTAILSVRHNISTQMHELAASLPEYSTVMAMYAVGDMTGPQLIAEIGDPRRFRNRRCITSFAGLDSKTCESGETVSGSGAISKRGSPLLRKILFIVINTYLELAPEGEPVYQFLDKKRAEGKNYFVYMTAAANKFLKIYYARVCEALNKNDMFSATLPIG